MDYFEVIGKEGMKVEYHKLPLDIGYLKQI